MTDRAQSSNVGLVLLVVLTVVGAGVVVAVGSTAYDDVQRQTSVDRAEHAMTLLDARTATVGLGEGSSQTVRLGRSSGGDYAVDSDAGWLRITHANHTGNATTGDEDADGAGGGEPEVIYNATLGSVTHRTGDTTVAYQGGGVWRQRGDGTSMVSPPEFHYRGTTLTLPVLRVRSDDAASGSATAVIRRDGDLVRVYPDETATYANSTRAYLNPIRNGTVSVTVGSEYYRGWAEYFRTRTTGTVSVDHDNRTATVVLESTDQVGRFTLPEKDDGIAVRGMADGHSVTDFQASIRNDEGTFNNLYASFYVKEGSTAYEAVVKIPGGTGGYCDGGGPPGDDDDDGGPDSVTLTMDVYYDDADTAEGVHRWSNDSIPADSGPVQLVCDDDDSVIEIDFTSTEQTLTYGESNVDDDTAVNWTERNASATASADPTTFDHAPDDGEQTTYNHTDTQNLRILTRHYFAEFDSNFDLRVDHGTGDRGNQQIKTSASGGVLEYDTAAGTSFITYLHVTENNVTVELS